LPDGKVFLRVWSPDFAAPGIGDSLDAAIGKISSADAVEVADGNLPPRIGREIMLTFPKPVFLPPDGAYERIYACPADLNLEPRAVYQISGWASGGARNAGRFEFVFQTDDRGRPVPF
jgi:hypothetical protein